MRVFSSMVVRHLGGGWAPFGGYILKMIDLILSPTFLEFSLKFSFTFQYMINCKAYTQCTVMF